MAYYTSNIVSSGTTWELGSGDTANYTSVYGTYCLSNGATDNVATVFTGGVEIVSSGAVAVNATISGGALNVYSAALVNGVSLKEGGWAGVSNGGTASNASVSSGAVLHVYSGGAVSTAKVFSSGRLDVRADATAQNVELNAGAIVGQFTQGTGTGSVSLISGTQVRGAATGLSGFGKLNIGQGGLLNDAAVSSGSINISSGGQAAQVRVFDDGSLAVLSGGSAAGITIENGADLTVNDGGFASDITVQQGGEVALFTHTGAGSAFIQKMSGGQAVGAVSTLDYDGALYAGSGAVLSSVTVNSGVMVLNSGAAASEIAAHKSGTIIVNAGAAVTTVEVSSNGSMNFAEDAVAFDVTVKNGGTVRTFTQVGDSDARIEKLTGGMITGAATQLDFTGTAYVGQGGSALVARVEDTGVMNVSSGGYVSGGSVLSGGQVSAGYGAQVVALSVLSGGQVDVSDGATLQWLVQSSGGNVNVTVEQGGVAQVSGTNEQGAFQLSGGTATKFVVYENGSMVVSSGASASGILIRSGGVMSASLAAEVTGSSVDMGMKFSISNGIRSGLNTLSNFVLMVESGYQINGQVLRGGGVQEVSFGGVVDSTTVSSGGMVEVDFGATATNVMMKDGGRIGLEVFGSAAETLVSGAYVDSGSRTFSLESGIASGFDLTSGSWMNVYSGGTATKTKVEAGGELVISSGGSANSIIMSEGAAIRTSVYGGDKVTLVSGSRADGKTFKLSSGYASAFLLENGGMLRVFSNGTASSTIVRENGSLIVEFGGIAGNTNVSSGGKFVANSSSIVSDVSIASGADVIFYNGVKLAGNIVLGGEVAVAGEVSADSATVNLDISSRTAMDGALVIKPSAFAGADFKLTVAVDQTRARYTLAEGASLFNSDITVYNTDKTYLGTFSEANRTFAYGNEFYHLLSAKDGELILSIYTPNSDLLSNGCSQIVAWDAAKGAVGYVMNAGAPSPAWGGIWEWSGSEKDMWKVVGVGRFQGSKTDHDGILLYNASGNTFAAWTDLTDPSYGYVSLCHVDDNFSTAGLADFDGNGFDDVIIYNEKGSVGIVSDAATYHDVWHVDDPASNVWVLEGSGYFNPGEQDSLLFRHTGNGHLYLWDNQDPSFATWDWTQKDIGYLADGWDVLGVGDFRGDGIDDIVLVNTNDNNAVFIWDDGKQSTQRYVGILESGFEIEAVGDYNGDGKEDLLLREHNTGWGGLGYWASGEASGWTDLNARIETGNYGHESNFAIIA